MTHQAPMFQDPNAPPGSLGATPMEWGRPAPPMQTYGYRFRPGLDVPPSIMPRTSGTMPGLRASRVGFNPQPEPPPRHAMGAADVSPGAVAWAAVSTASMATSAFHGYKRNQSVGWALWWGMCGALFPVITPAIAVAQGFGDRKRGR
jgi:hypothetical protein